MFMKSACGSMSMSTGLRMARRDSSAMTTGPAHLPSQGRHAPACCWLVLGAGPVPRSDIPTVTVEWSAQSSVNI